MIMVLNEDFQVLGAVPLYTTLIWNRRYYDYGSYELHTSTNYFPLLNSGTFMYRTDRTELGLIEDVEYAQDENGNKSCFAKGYFAEKLLADRVMPLSVNITGTPEEIGRQLVDTYAINPAKANRKIKGVILGKLSGIGTSIKMQDTGANLSDKLYSLEQTQQQSHRLKYDFLNDVLEFEVWEGLDRTQEQNVNSWAIFSNSYVNVKNIVYERDETSYKNFAYVAGEGEGANRVIVEVDIRESEDEVVREIYVDARDLQSERENGTKMSAADYRESLYQRGLEKLDEYKKIEVVNSGIDPLANLEYMVDFDLGDLCGYTNTDIGIMLNERITEIQEVIEKGKESITVTFGTDGITSITKIIKREAA